MKFFLAFVALFVAASAQDYGNTSCLVSKGNWKKKYQKSTLSKEIIVYLEYGTRAIISCGLYIFNPISKDHVFVFKEVFF